MHSFTSSYDLSNLCEIIVGYMSSLFLIEFIHILIFYHAFNMHSSCLLHYHIMVHIWRNIFEMNSLWLTILCTLKLIYILLLKNIFPMISHVRTIFCTWFLCANNFFQFVVMLEYDGNLNYQRAHKFIMQEV